MNNIRTGIPKMKFYSNAIVAIVFIAFINLFFYSSDAFADINYFVYSAPGRSVVQLVNSANTVNNTYEYDSFGNIKTATENTLNEFKYVGEQLDAESGLINLKNRYYDPSIGRFITKDIYPASKGNPQSINPYVYVNNNPVSYVDPLGLDGKQAGQSIIAITGGFLSANAGLGILAAATGPFGIIAGGALIIIGAGAVYLGDRNLQNAVQYLPPAYSTTSLVGYAAMTGAAALNGNVQAAQNFSELGEAILGLKGALNNVPNVAGNLIASGSNSLDITSSLSGIQQSVGGVYSSISGSLNTVWNAGVNFLTNAFNSVNSTAVASVPTDTSIMDTGLDSAADTWGGVDLNLTATLLGNVQDFGGATYDQATGQIILYGQQNVSLPPMDLDDLSVAVDSEYGLNGITPADPGVSIGTVASTVAGQMYVGYFGAVMNTEFGEVLFNSDRLLKSLSLGQDNITGQPVSVSVPGYVDMLNRYKAGGANGAAAVQTNPMSRMWFTPKQITLEQSADGSSMEFSAAVMQLLTSSQLNGVVETDPYSLAFAAEVTQDYNLYAAEFPVLQQLTRLGKITSVVKWIKDNNIPFDLSFFANYVPQSVPTECPSSNGTITEPSGCTSSQVCTSYACTPQYTPQTSVSTRFVVPGNQIDTITITGGVIYTLDASNFATTTDTTTTAPSTAAGQAAINARPSETNFSWSFNAQDQSGLPVAVGFLQRNM